MTTHATEVSPGLLSPDVRATLHSVLPGGWLITVDGVIADVGIQFCRLTGFEPEHLIGTCAPYAFWTSEDEGWEAVHQARRGSTDEIQMDLAHKDGHRIPVLFVTRTLLDPGGRTLGQVSVITDLDTEQARTRELEESRRLLDAAQEQAALGSWSWTAGPGGGSVLWSRQMYVLLGLDPETRASLKLFLESVHPDDAEQYGRMVADALRTGGTITADHRVVRPDGQVRHVHGTAEVHLDAGGHPSLIHGSAQDVTERVLFERELQASQEQFRQILASSPIGLALVDVHGRFTRVNDALCRILGWTEGELLGVSFPSITHPDDLAEDAVLQARQAAGEIETFQLDKRFRHADGQWIWVSLHVALVRDAAGAPMHYIGQIVDIDERRRRAEQLASQALTDPLTGLANRRAWEQSLREQLDRVHEGTGCLAVSILDLDYFKVFNDTYGHPVGDELLTSTAHAWTAYLRDACPTATLARIGGEEFALALPDTPADHARIVVRAMLALVGRDQTVSAGLTFAVQTDEPNTLMTRADAALYSAKHLGRNRCEMLLHG